MVVVVLVVEAYILFYGYIIIVTDVLSRYSSPTGFPVYIAAWSAEKSIATGLFARCGCIVIIVLFSGKAPDITWVMYTPADSRDQVICPIVFLISIVVGSFVSICDSLAI